MAGCWGDYPAAEAARKGPGIEARKKVEAEQAAREACCGHRKARGALRFVMELREAAREPVVRRAGG